MSLEDTLSAIDRCQEPILVMPEDMELPKAKLELTLEELYQVIGALGDFSHRLESLETFAHRHRAEHYRDLLDKFDDAYESLFYSQKAKAKGR